MEFENFSYVLVLAGTFAIPFFLGIKKQVGFFVNLKFLLPAILFSGAIFIIWDLRFEEKAIWRFNTDFVLGINILNLPVEEWLYFLVIPFTGVFIFEFVKIRFHRFEKANLFLAISLVLFLVFGILAYTSRQKMIPFFTFFLTAIYLGYIIFRNRFKKHFTKFYIAYFIFLVPFVVISGILTAFPIIEYNPEHILGTRLYSIPIENFVSLFLLLLMNISIYEYLKERHIY